MLRIWLLPGAYSDVLLGQDVAGCGANGQAIGCTERVQKRGKEKSSAFIPPKCVKFTANWFYSENDQRLRH